MLLYPQVYPNPSSSDLTLELEAPELLEVEVEVYDINGELVKHFEQEQYVDGLYQKRWMIQSQLPDGLYLVWFKTNYGNFQRRVLISKDGIQKN